MFCNQKWVWRHIYSLFFHICRSLFPCYRDMVYIPHRRCSWHTHNNTSESLLTCLTNFFLIYIDLFWHILHTSAELVKTIEFVKGYRFLQPHPTHSNFVSPQEHSTLSKQAYMSTIHYQKKPIYSQKNPLFGQSDGLCPQGIPLVAASPTVLQLYEYATALCSSKEPYFLAKEPYFLCKR